jgi:hypothetical protein
VNSPDHTYIFSFFALWVYVGRISTAESGVSATTLPIKPAKMAFFHINQNNANNFCSLISGLFLRPEEEKSESSFFLGGPYAARFPSSIQHQHKHHVGRG